MASVEEIRCELIDKIQSIENKEFLLAIQQLITSGLAGSKSIELTKEQIEMLEMSEEDIQNGRLISQEAMDKRNLEWLEGL
ncbi:hypothetical protein [Algoriphagus mannitolivorans]|uniref:hypothetical protein n=1 Tax=Algoriphagus mannitolivorans TaxID=226504 RepID=UPI00041976BB|nr:hypothetical protein [Algoriphagus mannitolivorans]